MFFRARDSLYFEPLVALAIVLLLLVSLFAYTSNWPPLYVVESKSMQHGDNWVFGVINTGDIVLAKQASANQISSYIVGLKSGYSTYGEYGDVVLYHPNGESAPTPIIHRALLYVNWNGNGSYDLSELAGLPCGSTATAVYSTPGTPGNCGTTAVVGTVDLYRIGWQSSTVSFNLTGFGAHSGYITMGDNNIFAGGTGSYGITDQSQGVSAIVDPGWIIGVARGIIPWFGATKLLLEGQAGMVPPQSWELMGITLATVLLVAFGIHYAFRAEGVEDPRRKAEEAAARREATEDRRRHPESYRLHPWDEAEDEREEETVRRRFFGRSHPKSKSRGRQGRPRPTIRRNGSVRTHRRVRRTEADDEL